MKNESKIDKKIKTIKYGNYANIQTKHKNDWKHEKTIKQTAITHENKVKQWIRE